MLLRRFFSKPLFNTYALRRNLSSSTSSSAANAPRRHDNRNLALILTGIGVLVLGGGYASVPLYRLFCQATGYGGTVQEETESKAERRRRMLSRRVAATESGEELESRTLLIRFNADVSKSLPWSFRPSQPLLEAETGETVLAFYRATNHTDKPLIGIATYNVMPYKVGKYFNKVQCFCFDEQRLQPHETVEMPVFFYVDDEMLKDRKCNDVKEIVLSYTFFLVNEDGMPEDSFSDDGSY